MDAPPPARRSLLDPLTLRGRERTVLLPRAAVLAPMDGITDPVLRTLVQEQGDAGGAVTEFVRLTTGPMSVAALRRAVGPRAGGIPVGLQFMTPGPEHLAESAARAAAAGADWVDLNFGCPVKRVFDKCAGSALLARPDLVEAIVAAAVTGTGLPVSAKIRAGIADASRLEEVLDAAARGGAAMVALHARLRTDSYAAPARWEWIARAAAFLRSRHPSVALLGNGGVERAADAHRMVRETGCDGVMVGRAAFADPFLFREIGGGPAAGPEEAAAFALRYLDAVLGPGDRRGAGKAKQLVRFWTAGGLFRGREGERAALLREPDAGVVRAWFAERALPAGRRPVASAAGGA